MKLEKGEKEMENFLEKAKESSRILAEIGGAEKVRVLHEMADALRANMLNIIEANALDMVDATKNKLSEALKDRLFLNEERI